MDSGQDADGELKPIAPFWFWNGAMEPRKITAQIRAMHAQGVDGFIICARQGLGIPYLSTTWFDRLRLAIETAEELGMDVWLYDEQPYPSLAGGGRVVLEHPEFEAKELKIQFREYPAGGHAGLDLGWGEVLLAMAYPIEEGDNEGAGEQRILWDGGIDISASAGQVFTQELFHQTGLTAYNRKRFLACEPTIRLDWTASGGGATGAQVPCTAAPDSGAAGDGADGAPAFMVFAAVQVPLRGHKYFDRFPDPLNPQAVEHFIRITHERYAQELGPNLAGRIKGIFTDEVHPIGFEGAGIPWSPRMPDLYRERWGEDLLPLLPALTLLGEEGFPDRERIRYRYMDTLCEGFMASFDQPLAAWCGDRGIRFIGEKPILRSSQLRFFHIPGIDAGHQKAGGVLEPLPARYRANPRILASAARLYGKRRCLCESFHSIGWGMEIQDMKWTYDWLALQGVNLFVNHAYFYTTAALAKHDAPPSSFLQMPWWKHQHLLSAYAQKLLSWTDLRDRQVRILLLDPIASLWTLPFGDQDIRTAEGEKFAHVQNILFRNHFDFWIIDSQLLGTAKMGKGTIDLGSDGSENNNSFDCLIIPPSRVLEDGALAAALGFARSGGTLVCCGPCPGSASGKYTQAEIERFWASGIQADGAEALPSILEGFGLRDFSIRDGDAEALDIQGMLYRDAQGYRSFILNPGTERRIVEVVLYNPAEGVQSVPASCTPHGTRSGGHAVRLELGPLESRFVRFDPPRAAEVHPSGRRSGHDDPFRELDLKKDHDLTLGNPNCLRLDGWELRIEGQDTVARVTAMPLADQLASGEFSVPVHLQDRFGTPKTLAFPLIKACYTAVFDRGAYSGPLELWVEAGAVRGSATIFFNDEPLPEPREARAHDGMERGTVPLPPALPGVNTITVRIDRAGAGDGIVAPLHLAGTFSVYPAAGNTEPMAALGPAPVRGSPLDRSGSGLPHFAGTLTYSGSIDLSAEDARRGLRLGIPNPDWRAACTLRLNGFDLGARAWHPYFWTAEASVLRPGANRYELQVDTDLLGYFEGQYYDSKGDRYLPTPL